jgi:hypothetical protein
VPVRVWARAVSSETVRQFQRLASQPYVVEFVAAMPDAHVAEGVAVGSVFATEHTVVPGALGGDLGCRTQHGQRFPVVQDPVLRPSRPVFALNDRRYARACGRVHDANVRAARSAMTVIGAPQRWLSRLGKGGPRPQAPR